MVAFPAGKSKILMWSVLLSIYFPTRLFFIFRFPPFNDEVILLRWGQIMIETPQRFYSLIVGGKPPLVYWIYGLLMRVIADPLLAGRSLSLVVGLGTLILVYQITQIIYGRRGGYLAGILYAISPLMIFYDSLALVDGILSLLFAGTLLVLLRLNIKPDLKYFGILGTLIGFSLWIKNTAMVYLAMALIFIIFWYLQKKITETKLLIGTGLMLAMITLLILPLITNREFFHVWDMQKIYGLTLQEIWFLPWPIWISNLRDAILVYIGYLTPLIIPGILTVFLLRRENQSGSQLLAYAFLIALASLVITGRSLHSRYVLFTAISLISLTAGWLTSFRQGGWLLALIFPLTVLLTINQIKFFQIFPSLGAYATDRWQYIEGWPAGYGVKEAISFIDKHRQGQAAFVGVRWDSGNPEDAVLLYAPRLAGVSAGFLDQRLGYFKALVAAQKNKPIYFVTRDGQYGKLEKQLTLLSRFTKPGGKAAVEVFIFKP